MSELHQRAVPTLPKRHVSPHPSGCLYHSKDFNSQRLKQGLFNANIQKTTNMTSHNPLASELLLLMQSTLSISSSMDLGTDPVENIRRDISQCRDNLLEAVDIVEEANMAFNNFDQLPAVRRATRLNSQISEDIATALQWMDRVDLVNV